MPPHQKQQKCPSVLHGCGAGACAMSFDRLRRGLPLGRHNDPDCHGYDDPTRQHYAAGLFSGSSSYTSAGAG